MRVEYAICADFNVKNGFFSCLRYFRLEFFNGTSLVGKLLKFVVGCGLEKIFPKCSILVF